MSRKARKVHKKVEGLVMAWLAQEPEPVAETLEEYEAQGYVDMLDTATLASLYGVLVDSQKAWQDEDGIVASRLRRIAGIAALWTDEQPRTDNAARDSWERDKRNRQILTTISWELATPASPDEIR